MRNTEVQRREVKLLSHRTYKKPNQIHLIPKPVTLPMPQMSGWLQTHRGSLNIHPQDGLRSTPSLQAPPGLPGTNQTPARVLLLHDLLQEPSQVSAMSVLSGTGTHTLTDRLVGPPLSGLNCLLVETRAPKDYDRGGDTDLGGRGRWMFKGLSG